MERPPYEVVPPGDTLGLRHAREALRDLDLPMRTSELRERVGAWRMPITGTRFEPLSTWLEGVPERKFVSVEDIVEAIAQAHPELRE